MLPIKLAQQVSSSIFSNSSLRNILNTELICRYAKKKFPKGSFHKKCVDALVENLDNILAKKIKINELEKAYSKIWPDTMFSDSVMPPLKYLFEKNFMTDEGHIFINKDSIQEFAKLSSKIDPAVVVGWGLAEHFSKKKLTLEKIIDVSLSSHASMYIPQSDEPCALAENHIHLGGAYGVNVSFFSGIFSDAAKGKLSDDFSSLRRWLIPLIGLSDLMNASAVENILKNEFSGAWATTTPVLADWKGWAALPLASNASTFAKVRQVIAISWVKGDADKAWLGIHFWLWLCYIQTQNRWLRLAIVLAMVIMMIERNQVITQGIGLSRFIQGYHRASRKHSSDELEVLASTRRIFSHELDVAEIKIAAQDIEKIIPLVTNAIAMLSMEKNNSEPTDNVLLESALNSAFSRWHCCLHFFRLEKYLRNPGEILTEAKDIGKKLSLRPRWQLSPEIEELAPAWANARIGDWIRGIDVAGNENLVRIEYFAPALRLLRDVIFHSENARQAYAPIHLSLHAGEDYFDITSGLRHIDESIQFCNMKKGDRLGHALALGVPPLEWAQGKENIFINLDEHIDNIVWVWKKSKDLALTGFDDVRDILAERAMLLFQRLPWVSDSTNEAASHYTVENLAEEWALRRNSYDHYISISSSRSVNPTEDATVVPDYHILCMNDNPASRLFMMRARWVRDFHSKDQQDKTKDMPVVNLNISKITGRLACKVRLTQRSDEYIEDIVFHEQLDLLHSLQNAMYNEYSTAGLQIEVNLTSNAYIGEFGEYYQHPIFRWNRYETKDPIALTINTDDPGVMPTNLRLEFALLREAACDAGLQEAETLAWLEKLGEAGLREFEEKHKGVQGFSASDFASNLIAQR